jgi:general stress protein 26
MPQLPIESLTYLNTQRIGVFAVEMLDGSPHAATVHFAHTDEPFQFLIRTSVDSLKSQPLIKHGEIRASFVIGVDENNMKTFQLNGIARIIPKHEEETFSDIFMAKFPTKEVKVNDPKTACIMFTPTWWRFTDWKTPEGKRIWTS